MKTFFGKVYNLHFEYNLGYFFCDGPKIHSDLLRLRGLLESFRSRLSWIWTRKIFQMINWRSTSRFSQKIQRCHSGKWLWTPNNSSKRFVVSRLDDHWSWKPPTNIFNVKFESMNLGASAKNYRRKTTNIVILWIFQVHQFSSSIFLFHIISEPDEVFLKNKLEWWSLAEGRKWPKTEIRHIFGQKQ